MSSSSLGTAKAKVGADEVLTRLDDNDLEDWDMPPINVNWPTEIIRARVIDAEAK